MIGILQSQEEADAARTERSRLYHEIVQLAAAKFTLKEQGDLLRNLLKLANLQGKLALFDGAVTPITDHPENANVLAIPPQPAGEVLIQRSDL